MYNDTDCTYTIIGFKAFFGANNRQSLARQDSVLGSAFTSGAWIVPAAVIAVGGLFRDGISDLLSKRVFILPSN